jgi:predicted dinucleotide-binding enzyme
MRIGILGAGAMAEALAPHWIAAGHEVMVGGRTQSRVDSLTDRLGAAAGTLRQAAEFGEGVVLAVLSAGIDGTLAAAGARDGTLAGKVLIDCNNAVETERFTLVLDGATSLAERLAAETGADVVKALNQVHSEVWSRGARYGGDRVVVPIAGSEHAKDMARRLVADAGGEPVDAGDLDQAHNLEAMAAMIIRLLFGGADPLSAFQLTVGTSR